MLVSRDEAKKQKIHIELPGSALEESLPLKIKRIFVVRSLLRMSCFMLEEKKVAVVPVAFVVCKHREFSVITGLP